MLVTGGAVRLTRIVGVTRFAVNELPNGELAAVLAHELIPSALGVAFVVPGVGILAAKTIDTLYGLPKLVLAIPYVFAVVGRVSQLRADRYSADLGFAPMPAFQLDLPASLFSSDRRFPSRGGSVCRAAEDRTHVGRPACPRRWCRAQSHT